MIRTKRGGERKVLDYHDVLLREQDVALLDGPDWLNDQVISFYFEYLEREWLAHLDRQLQEGPKRQGQAANGVDAAPPPGPAGTSAGSSSNAAAVAGSVLMLPPSTSFLLMHSPPKVAAEVLAPLRPGQRGLVLFAVNDNPHVDATGGGSHWSLLVYHRPSNTLRHYNSSPAAAVGGGSNARAARALAAAVCPALSPAGAAARDGSGGCGGGNGGEGGKAVGRPADPRFVEVRCMPRQANGYDCGVYVLAVARALCGWWLGAERAGTDARRRARVEGDAAEAAEVDGDGPDGNAVAGATDGTAAAESEADWAANEAAMAGWLTPAFASGMRAEVLQLIRDKAAAAASGAGAGTRTAS